VNDKLDKYVELCELFYADSFTIVLDLERKVVFVGKKYLEVVKRTKEEMIGRHLYETTPIPENNRKLSGIAFPEAIRTKQTKQVFISNLYHPYPESHILMLLFSPIIADQNEVIASRLDFTPVDISYFFQILININNKIEPSDLPDNDDFLTTREHQVAFLLCHCKSPSEIAQVLSLFNHKDIQAKTVNNIISRYLFPKFSANSKIELIDKLKEMNYDKKMPNSLLSNQFIDLTKHQLIT
jgi:hypothetical protein